jgi:hypothetical protein
MSNVFSPCTLAILGLIAISALFWCVANTHSTVGAGTVVLRDVRVIDGEGGPSLEHGAIVIDAGHIVSVGPVDRVRGPLGKNSSLRNCPSHPNIPVAREVYRICRQCFKRELAVEPVPPVAGILAVHLQFVPGYRSHPPERYRWAPELRRRTPQRDDHI